MQTIEQLGRVNTAFERLEPYDGKLSRTVLRGLGGGNTPWLPGIALYQAYMETAVGDISKNPALFTAVNKDTSEIYHELVAFDAALAQEASDRGVNILRATDAGETLPRIFMDPENFSCRFCDWKEHCWQEFS